MAFRKLGEICGEYLSKGRQVYVEGRLQTSSWEKDGVTRYTTEIVASDVQFLGGRDSANSEGQSLNTQVSDTPKSSGSDKIDDDIPF